MPKIHTRIKRKMGRGKGTSFAFKSRLKTIVKKNRPKTFASEEGAKKYALEKGIKDFTLQLAKKNKRFMIVETA